MDIIYIWDSNLNRNDTGIMLSGKYSVKYDPTKAELDIKRNINYVEGFWGKRVRGCFAIVGDNGSGKTVLVNCIMEHISMLKTGTNPNRDFLLIGEDEKEGSLSVYYTEGIGCPEPTEQNGVGYQSYLIGSSIKSRVEGRRSFYLRDYEIAYFHNVLSRYDYCDVQSRCRYDFALGAMINRHRRTTSQMHYDRPEKDAIRNYYDKELFRIITFLYDEEFHNRLHMDYPMPQWIYIRIADERYSEEYIVKETKELEACRDGEISEEDIQQFVNRVDKLANTLRDTWAAHTIKNLILNCYRELCIPKTAPSHRMAPPQVFFDACEFLERMEIDEHNLYACASKITENLQWDLEDEWNLQYIDAAEAFIKWLRTNRARIRQATGEIYRQLNIQVTEQNKEFITELIGLYSKVNFEFPFYDFSFDVSTGEIDFLITFSNLYSMVCGNDSEINVYDYPKLEDKTRSLLLIFDEADISMHPKWQRMYMKWMTDFCEQLFGNRYIKIMITTHSPILLSDFPANSILYLQKDNGKVTYWQEDKETFGSNIHSLYLDSFFLEKSGTMGAFAEQKINEIAELLLGESMAEVDYERIHKVIGYIGEGVIRRKLEEELNRARREKASVMDSRMHDAEQEILGDTLTKLKEQRNYMDQLIKELERKAYDKNRS